MQQARHITSGMYIHSVCLAHAEYEGIATENPTMKSRSISPMIKPCLKFFLKASQKSAHTKALRSCDQLRQTFVIAAVAGPNVTIGISASR